MGKYQIIESGMNAIRDKGIIARDRMADDVLDLAKANCPIDTKALHDSATTYKDEESARVVFGESNAVAALTPRKISYTQKPLSRWGATKGQVRGPEFYALWVEIGYRHNLTGQHIPGRHFMENALKSVFEKPVPLGSV